MVCDGVGSMSGIGFTVGRGTKVGLIVAVEVVEVAGLVACFEGTGVGLLFGTRRERGKNMVENLINIWCDV